MMLNKKEFKQVMVLLMERIMYMQNFNRRVQYTGPCQKNEILPKRNFMIIFWMQ